ncbi:MAG: ABC transporter substrate-binding protein [Alphaproteobacteria bacterium]
MKTTSIKGLAAAVALGAVVASGATVANAQEPFRLIITEPETPLVPNSVMILAQELGYFEAAGVDVELIRVSDTTLAVAALQAGEGEMANIGLDAALLIVANDVLDIRAVTSPNKFLPFLIACKDDVASIADIAGRTFGINRIGSLDYGLSRMVMTANGLDVETLEYVPIGFTSARAEALAAGQIDCATMSIGVWLSIPDRTDLRIVVPVGPYGDAAPVVNKVNVVTADTLATRGDQVEAVVRALIALSREFNSNPQAWVDAMLVSRPDQSVENLNSLALAFVGAWSVNGGLNADELAFSVERVFEGDDFAGFTAPALSDWVDFTVIDNIIGIGVDPAADAPAR